MKELFLDLVFENDKLNSKANELVVNFMKERNGKTFIAELTEDNYHEYLFGQGEVYFKGLKIINNQIHVLFAEEWDENNEENFVSLSFCDVINKAEVAINIYYQYYC